MALEASEEQMKLDFFAKKDSIESKERTESERKVICYNPRCEDYRKERPYDVACSCKINRVPGAGI